VHSLSKKGAQSYSSVTRNFSRDRTARG